MNSRMMILPLAAALALTGCVNSKDLAKTLRYADERAISVADFKFADLGKLSKGEACTVNFMNWLPLWGDGSLITAIERGKINRIHYIGETGYWYFPFSTNCTVVFGSDEPPPLAGIAQMQEQRGGISSGGATTAPARPGSTPAEPAPRKHDFW
jgi:hypothetical protein